MYFRQSKLLCLLPSHETFFLRSRVGATPFDDDALAVHVVPSQLTFLKRSRETYFRQSRVEPTPCDDELKYEALIEPFVQNNG